MQGQASGLSSSGPGVSPHALGADSQPAPSTPSKQKERKNPLLIVGLGNPGAEYLWTPHNAGFMAVDRLANQAGVEVLNRRCRSLTATTRIAGHEVILAKPETFMNLSGEAVRLLLKEFEADPFEDLIVIYDDLDLTLGRAQMKERGSPAGHNGARSVSGTLRTNDWLRVRVGVGPNLPAEAIAAGAASRTGKDYLLSPLRKAELAVLDEVLDRVATAVRVVVEEGVAAAMNGLNRRET